MEAGFDSDIGGDVPDWDNTESRESDEDAAWRDLVARFEEPTTAAGPAPWPEREDVPGPREQAAQATDGTDGTSGVHGADGAHGAESALGGCGTGEAQGSAGPSGSEEPRRAEEPSGSEEPRRAEEPSGSGDAQGTRGNWDVRDTDEVDEAWGPGGPAGAEGRRGPDGARGAGGFPGARGADHARGARGVEGIRGFDDEGVRRAFEPSERPETSEPDVIQAARRDRRAAAHGTHARKIRARKAPPRVAPDGEEHFIPPAPPPLPSLDPIAKGAWAALFGGPGYLVVATAAGWSVSGIAAFCAVAAFVAGFAILVLRMNEPGAGGPDDGDDGAVV